MNLLLERLLLSGAVAALIVSIYRATKSVRQKSSDPESRRESEKESEESLSQPGGLKNVAYAAGVPIPFAMLMFILLEVGGLVALMLWEQFEVRWPGFLGFILVPIITIGILVEVGRRRALIFEEKLIHALELLIGALRSGDSLRKAFDGLIEISEDPVRSEFQKLVGRLDLGFEMRRAILPLLKRYQSEGLRLFATTLVAKSKVGGDMAPVLESLNRVLRDRLKFRVRVSSKLSGAKYSALMIGSTPYLLLLVFYAYKPEWLQRIFEHEFGPILFVAAVCVQLLGFAGLFRMQRIEL